MQKRASVTPLCTTSCLCVWLRAGLALRNLTLVAGTQAAALLAFRRPAVYARDRELITSALMLHALLSLLDGGALARMA